MAFLPGPQLWDASFDYVRLTARGEQSDDATGQLYQLAGRSILAGMDGGELQTQVWDWYGYRGWSGPHVQVGFGRQGHIFQASGYAAASARDIPLPFDGVPRADVAITMWFDQDKAAAIRDICFRSREVAATKGAVGWKTTFIDGGEYGNTAYIGARTSDTYTRIYDKWRESDRKEEYQYALRFEVEYKNEAAVEVWSSEGRTAPGREWLQAVVRETLRKRAVWLPELCKDNMASAPLARTIQTTNERRLNWLRTQVAPSIGRLLTDGYNRDMIAELLGLA